MILALHTAGATTSLWLLDPAQAAAPAITPAPLVQWESGRHLADELLARLTLAVAEAGCELRQLTGIIIFSGPGSFTSLRIGHSVANALADSLGLPIVGRQGEDWLSAGLQALATKPSHHPVLPHYGSEATITKRKA
jgi:tRNA threonylcarbamoyladenosine biosynthesis protein TsaB